MKQSSWESWSVGRGKVDCSDCYAPPLGCQACAVPEWHHHYIINWAKHGMATNFKVTVTSPVRYHSVMLNWSFAISQVLLSQHPPLFYTLSPPSSVTLAVPWGSLDLHSASACYSPALTAATSNAQSTEWKWLGMVLRLMYTCTQTELVDVHIYQFRWYTQHSHPNNTQCPLIRYCVSEWFHTSSCSSWHFCFSSAIWSSYFAFCWFGRENQGVKKLKKKVSWQTLSLWLTTR